MRNVMLKASTLLNWTAVACLALGWLAVPQSAWADPPTEPGCNCQEPMRDEETEEYDPEEMDAYLACKQACDPAVIICGPRGFYRVAPSCSGICFAAGPCSAGAVDNVRSSGGERIPGAGNITVYYCSCA